MSCQSVRLYGRVSDQNFASIQLAPDTLDQRYTECSKNNLFDCGSRHGGGHGGRHGGGHGGRHGGGQGGRNVQNQVYKAGNVLKRSVLG